MSASIADPADARGKIVRITARGRKARECGRQFGAARHDETAWRSIGADEFARALPFLVKLRQVLDAARD